MNLSQQLTINFFLHPRLEGCERVLRAGERENFLPLYWQQKVLQILAVILLMLLSSDALSQDRGRITGTKCIVSGGSPTLTSLRDATGVGGVISWQKSNNINFTGTIGVDVILIGAATQSYTDGPITASTFYRRILTIGGGATLYSDTIKVTVIGVVSHPTFSPQIGTTTEICQQTTSFNVTYTTTNTPDKYSIIWSPAAISEGFQDVYNATLPPAAFPITNNFSVDVPAAVNAGTFSGTLIAINTTTGCTVSNGSQITVNALPVISVQPATTVQNICLSGTATDLSITAATPGGVITTTSVQWYSNVANSNSGGSVVATHPAPPATDTYTPQTSVANALYYYAVVTNSKSCVRTSDVSGLITINAIPSAPAVSNNGPVCVGATLSLTTATLSGAIYSWLGPGGFASAAQNPSVTTTSTAESGTYSLTVTVNGCTSAASSTAVTVKSTPSTPTAANGGAVCAGTPLQLTTASVSTATYAWTGPGGFTSAAQNPLVPTTSTAESGTYSLTVTVNGCTSAVSSTTATVNAIPSTPSAANGGAVCVGTPLQLTTASVIGATYAWTGPGGFSSVLQNPSVPTTSTAESGTYSLTITVNGCTSAVSSTTATVNAIPSTPSAANGGAVCVGTSLQLTTASVIGATYVWTGPGGFSSVLQNPLVPTTSTAASGTYSLTVTVNGCTSAVSSTTATVNATPSPPTVGNGGAVCAGSPIQLTATPVSSATYSWTGPGGFTSAAQNPLVPTTSTAASGTYSLTITVNGCTSAVSSTTATVNAIPSAPTVGNGGAVCAGTPIQLTATPVSSATYAWTGPNGFVSSVQSPSVLTTSTAASGTYSLTVTVNGCTSAISSTSVTVKAIPATPSVTNSGAVCVGTPLQLNSASVTGAIYSWTGPNGFTSAVQNPSVITTSTAVSGTYSLTVTVNGCTSAVSTTTATVNAIPVTPVINLNGPACVGSSLNLGTASVTGATYAWTGPNSFSTSSQNPSIAAVTTSATGMYSLRVTVNNCTSPAGSALVTVNTLPTVTITAGGSTTFCSGGSVTLTAGGGTTYVWSTGSALNAIATTTSGTISVIATDANGCKASSLPITITVNPLPNLIITHPAAVCAPGTVNLTAAAVTAGSTAGTVFTYFTDAATSIPFTTPTTTGVAGTYYIKGTLPTGCSSSRAVTVVVNNPPSLTTQNPTAVCAPQTVDLSSPAITQGSDNGLVYTYFTNAALSTPLLNPTAVGNSGVYYIKANAPGSACSAALPVTVTVHPVPTGNLQTPAVNYVCSGSTLPLTATDAFAYQWLLNQTPIAGATNAVYQASTAGVYSVRFISQEGCVREATNTLRIDQLVKPVLRLQWNSRCVAVPVSFSNLSTYASSGGINWLWDFGDGALANTFSPTHTYATAGNYTVSLTANNISCPTLTETISIPVYVDSARVPVRYPTVKAVAGKAFPLTARSLGALYRWQPATGLNSTTVQSPMATLNNDIEYTVTITNSASCTTTDTVAVKLVFDGNIFVGNGFTPNGDGVNDRCYPILTGVRSLVYFKIYNRWGNLVFQTNDASPQNGWDGKYNGRLQPVGTYTWIAEAIDGNGNMFQRNGNVLLIN